MPEPRVLGLTAYCASGLCPEEHQGDDDRGLTSYYGVESNHSISTSKKRSSESLVIQLKPQNHTFDAKA